MNEDENLSKSEKRILQGLNENALRTQMEDDFWTPSLLPVESHRDILKDIATPSGIAELLEIAILELGLGQEAGVPLTNVVADSATTIFDIERRIELEARTQKASVDPLGKSPGGIAMLVAALRGENPGAKVSMADYVDEWIRDCDSKSLQALAKLGGTPAQSHRNHRMLRILLEFHDANGRFPTKAEARKVVNDREMVEARDPRLERWAQQFPGNRSTKEWNTIWQQCGVPWLEVAKGGRPRKK